MKKYSLALLFGVMGLNCTYVLADFQCSGARLLSNFYEVQITRPDGSSYVYYTQNPVIQVNVSLALSIKGSGPITLAANVDEISAPTVIFSGPLALQNDGKTYSSDLGSTDGTTLPNVEVTGSFLSLPSETSNQAVFQVNGVTYNRVDEFGIANIFLSMGNDLQAAEAQIPLQCGTGP